MTAYSIRFCRGGSGKEMRAKKSEWKIRRKIFLKNERKKSTQDAVNM